jgi:type II secretory pathway predicted ATPase ExeA
LTVNRYQDLATVLLFDDVDEAEQDVITAIVRLAQWKPAADARITIVVGCHENRTELLGPRLIDLCELRIELCPWEAADTAEFVRQVCLRAGREEPIFSLAGTDRLHEISAGIPRRIRQIAELALLAGAGAQLETIDAEIIDDVVAELSAKGSGISAALTPNL